MSVTAINGDFIHYEVLGRGKPIIFIHGWLGSWRYWWPCMQTLSKQHRVFAYDQWGFGDSTKVGSKYSFEAYLDLLEKFVTRLGINGPLSLVGHDLGAAVALRYAKLNPERVGQLVTIALPIYGTSIEVQLANGNVDSFITRYLTKKVPYPELKQEFGKHDMAAVTALASQLIRYDFFEDLEKVKSPVLLVFGDRNPVIKVPDDLYSVLDNENLHFVMLDGSSHFPMLEETAVFNRLVQDFIASRENAAVTPKDYWQRRTR